MELHKLQTALGAGVRPRALVLQEVVLELAAVGKRLVALGALEGVGPLVAGLVAFEVGVGGELHATLRADVAAPALVLHLMRSQLAGIGKAAAAEAAAVGFDVGVLEHVSLQVAGLGEALLADGALVGPRALMGQQVGLKMAGLLEELPTMWTGMRFDAVVAQDVRDQVVLGGVRFITHAALPALQTVPHIYAVRLIDLDVDIQPVNPAATVPTGWLVGRRLLVLPSSAPICPHHALAAIFVLSPHAHFRRVIAAYLTGLKVAADGFLLLRGLHHVVPLVFNIFFSLSATPTVAPHRALALQSSVALLPSSVAHLGRRRVNVCVGLRLIGRFSFTLRTVLVGASEGGWIHLYQPPSGSHIVEHVDTRGQSRVYPFPFHMGRGHVSTLKAVTVGANHFPIRVLRRPLLPPPLTAAGLHLAVFSQVVS